MKVKFFINYNTGINISFSTTIAATVRVLFY